MSVFQDLNDQGITIMVVTHDPDVAVYAKRVIVMRDGLIIEDRLVEDRQDAHANLADYGPPETDVSSSGIHQLDEVPEQ
jgi:putative ABC transport system ATP-binding protein